MKVSNIRKKALQLGLAAMLLLGAAAMPAPSVKADADAYERLALYFPADIDDHWAYAELDNFVNADLLKGYVDHEGTVTVKPNQSISRAEFVALLVRALGLTEVRGEPAAFDDVAADQWYAEPVRIASSHGIVQGVEADRFGPDQRINRGEIATMVVRAFRSTVDFSGEAVTFTDVPNYYAKPSIEAASRVGVVQGVSAREFKPYAPAKRAEAVVMLQRALDLQAANLPDDAVLINVIAESEQESRLTANSQNFEYMKSLAGAYYDGYYEALNMAFVQELAEMAKAGVTIKTEMTAIPHYTVLMNSTRFAVVEATGGQYRIATNDNGIESVETVPADAIYMLRKTNEGNWKIYASY
jgi:S-layer homology domain.